ncbi:MAG: alanine racemase [Eubacteriales bacterium]|nr:alanine racemase [Eubacteriales bacterium]
MTSKTQRIRAEVDLGAILYNMEQMHAYLQPQTQMIATVKADGYGHGAVPVARALESLPFLWGYATATYEEAADLRSAGIRKPILILGYVFPYCYRELARLEIRPAVFREDMLSELSRAAEQEGKRIRVHIAVDTGMSRIGIRPDESGLDFVKKAAETDGIETEGIFTHFARADEADKSAARDQFSRFCGFVQRAERETGRRIALHHAANSAAIVELPECQLDLVRAGITMYGLWPSEEVSREILPLRPALSLYSHIVYVKEVPAGVPVSYGGTFVTQGTTRIATIPVGYGDGYPRSLSNKGWVLVHGKRAPVLGRICMDQFMVDVTGIPQAREGDEVTLLGTDGQETLSMEELGELSGRFHYEFACDLSARVPRVYREARHTPEHGPEAASD